MFSNDVLFVLSYLGIQTLATVSPGPAFAVVTQKSLSVGRIAGAGTAVGCAAGTCVWLSATMLGLSFLVTRFWWFYEGLRVCGGLFLVYLAVQLWRHARDPAPSPAARAEIPGGFWPSLRAGLVVQLSNPKALAYCVSVLVTLLPPVQPIWMKAGIPLAGTVIETGWWLFVAWAFSTGAFRERYARLKSLLDRSIGTVLGLLGAKLLLEAR